MPNRYLRALRELRDEYQRRSGETVGPEIESVAALVERIESQYPGVLPPFDTGKFRGRWPPAFGRYEVTRVHAWLAAAVGILEALPEEAPVLEERDFAFIRDGRIRPLLVRDFAELRLAFAAKCWKSVILLCGAIVEGMLLDALSRLPKAAEAKGAPRTPVENWNFYTKLEVAVRLGIVTAGVAKLGHSLREYRNLVHPGVELTLPEPHPINREEAAIALEVLRIVYRDLAAAKT